MQVSSDSVVSFHYTLKEEGGEVFESSVEADPILYMQGRGGMIQGLEEAMEGKSVDEAFEVTVTPEKGYGKRKEGESHRIPKKHLLTKGKLTPGMIIQVNTANGPEEAILLKVGLKNVDIDANHPLAGKTLVFDVKIVDIREATSEEKDHGHAHGVGGHQH